MRTKSFILTERETKISWILLTFLTAEANLLKKSGNYFFSWNHFCQPWGGLDFISKGQNHASDFTVGMQDLHLLLLCKWEKMPKARMKYLYTFFPFNWLNQNQCKKKKKWLSSWPFIYQWKFISCGYSLEPSRRDSSNGHLALNLIITKYPLLSRTRVSAYGTDLLL